MGIRLAFCSLALTLVPVPALAQQDDALAFRNGRTNVFTSKGHPKAEGLEVTFKVPLGWTPREGNRPHVVVNFDNSERTVNCSLLIIDTKEKLSRLDAIETFSPNGLRELAPLGAVVHDTQSTNIDGLPAGQMIYTLSQNNAGVQVSINALMFVTFYSRHIIQFSCYAGDIGRAVGASAKFRSFMPVFVMMASSLVVQNQWRGK